MLNLKERGRIYLSDMKKRAARELGLGYLTQEEYNKLMKCQEEMEKIFEVSESRQNKENENEDK